MLNIEGLNSFYGDSHILHGINLEISPRQRVALLGRNGAGKSTLLKSIMNAGPAVRGTIVWEGTTLGDKAASHHRAQLGLCLVPEDRRILPNLTVFENLKFAWGGVPKDQRRLTPDSILSDFPMLVPIRDRKGGLLSGGQQQLLALARAALSRPRLLMLDEPTEGLAPVIVERLVDDVHRICESESCGLLLCEQNVWFARRCTDHVYVLDTGHLVFSGNWDEFEGNSAIKERHLAV